MTANRMRAAVLTWGVGLVLFSVSSAQNTATIVGTIRDSSDGAIPGASINVSNEGTGMRWRTSSKESGIYVIPLLPPGAYAISVLAEGFRPMGRTGVRLPAAGPRRIDFVLTVGSIGEAIEVTSPLTRLHTDTPEVGTDLSREEMAKLPLTIGRGRHAENFAYKLVPGVSGDSWRGYIVGSTSFSKESLLDGASVTTNRAGHYGESAVSMEALEEFKIHTSGLSAEFGRTQAGVLNYVMKSGTNDLHGSMYGMLRNEVLNANTFANKARGDPRPLDRKHIYAGSLGGPVYIPKLYDGRHKTFFYAAYERYHEKQLGLGAPSRTVPLPEFYMGDFSRLLGPATGYSDALGNNVPQGGIYDPASFHQLSDGRWAGTLFPNNTIPRSRFSSVAQRLNAIATQSYLPVVRNAAGGIPLTNNAHFPITGIPMLDQYQTSLKVDQNLTGRFKIFASYAHNLRPRLTAQPNGAPGMWSADDEFGGPLSKARRQRLTSHFARAAVDWTATPAILNRVTVYFNRFVNDNATAHRNINGAKALGIAGLESQGYPDVNWGDGPFVALASPGSSYVQYSAVNSWGVKNTASLVVGSHLLKFGIDFRRAQYNDRGFPRPALNFLARATALPNEAFSGNLTGYSFASYLLGIVDNASLDDPVGLGHQTDYLAGFLQDDLKLGPRLSLQLGFRWDWVSPMREVADRMSSWNPLKIDPASGLPGAYDFAGGCLQCTGNSYFGRRDWNNFAPRIGLAYRLSEKSTFRAAYGILYEGAATHRLTLGKAGHAAWGGTYTLNPDPVEPWRGIFNWDDGFPVAERFVPASFDASWGSTSRPAMFDPAYGTAPYLQRWNANVQYAITDTLLLDIGYLGGKGTALRAGDLRALNQVRPEMLAAYGERLNNPVRSMQEAARQGVPYPYPGFQGTVASALREHPQVVGNRTVRVVGAPLGFSTTHSLQAVLNRQFSEGLSAYVNYTWSKTLTNVASSIDGENYGRPLDYYNLRLEKSVAEYDVPHMFKAFVSYELPIGTGKQFLSGAGGWKQALAGGWTISAILNYFSGYPLGFTGSSPLSGGWNGVGRRIDILPGPMKNPGFRRSGFELSDLASPGNTYLNKTLYSDPSPLTLGSSAYRYSQTRGFGIVSEDIALQKSHQLGERFRLRFRLEFLNAFNRHQLADIETSVTNPLFGQVTNITGNRTVQVGGRVDF